MKLKVKLISSIALMLLLLIAWLSGCSNINNKAAEPVDKTEFLMGTICTIKLYDNPSDKVFKEAFDRIREIENKMSINLSDSEITKLNTEAGNNAVKLSKDSFFVLQKGKYYSELSKGKFDITIGPLVKLWGIGTSAAKVPAKKELIIKQMLVDYNNLQLDSDKNEAFLKKEGMIVDLGGIAKGYAADEAAKVLRENNIKHGIINIGGNVYVLGNNVDGAPWKIGIQDPFSQIGDIIGFIKVSNKSIVTSGIYERYFEKDNIKYHHILDPFTGYPAENNIAGVSIISNTSIDGDALSTTTFSLGLKEGTNLIESLDGIEAVFITKDKEIFVTKGLKNNFKLTNEEFIYKE